MTDALRIARRVRHPLKFRLLEVVEVFDLTPSLKRVVLTGDLEDFVSLGFDDHVKIFPSGRARRSSCRRSARMGR